MQRCLESKLIGLCLSYQSGDSFSIAKHLRNLNRVIGGIVMDRIEEIKKKIASWMAFELSLDVTDIMPDLIYLVDELEKVQSNSGAKKATKNSPKKTGLQFKCNSK